MFFLIPLILTLLILMTFFSISKKNHSNLESLSSFECGYNPLSPHRNPFSLQFFKITILFLMFDIEIILITPLPLFSFTNIFYFLSTSTILLIILMGFIFEWSQGILNWIK